MSKYLEAIRISNPEGMVSALQEFFKAINSTNTTEGFDLVSLYSTVQILEVNGLNKASVEIIKAAIKAKMDTLFSSSPLLMHSAKCALDKIMINEPV